MIQEYLEKKYNVLPTDGKKPAGPWKELQTQKADWHEAKHWEQFGVVCGDTSGDLYVIDYDNKEEAREFFRKYKNILKTITETRNGCHFYFQGKGRNFTSEKYDGRGQGGYVIGAGVTIGDWTYRFVPGHGLVPPEELPVLPEGLVPKSKPILKENGNNLVERARKYLQTIQSFSGERGHDSCYRAAAVCLQKFGLDEATSLALLWEWNQTDNVDEKWTMNELRKKISDLRGE